MPPFLPRIGSEIPVAGGAPGTVAEIDSLVRIHPELRALLLRQFLVPSPALPEFGPLSDSERFAAYMREHIPVSPFERMSQLARRHAANFDIPLHPAFRDYQLDILATIHWLLGLSP